MKNKLQWLFDSWNDDKAAEEKLINSGIPKEKAAEYFNKWVNCCNPSRFEMYGILSAPCERG